MGTLAPPGTGTDRAGSQPHAAANCDLRYNLVLWIDLYALYMSTCIGRVVVTVLCPLVVPAALLHASLPLQLQHSVPVLHTVASELRLARGQVPA